MWMFLTSVIERSCWKSLCGLNSKSRHKVPSSLYFNTAVLQRPGKWSWCNTKLEQVSSLSCKGCCLPGSSTRNATGAGALPAEFAVGVLQRWKKEAVISECPGWPAEKAGATDFQHHTHHILTQIRWNCSGSQCSCHHQLQDTHSTPESLWTGKDWEWQCHSNNNSGSPFHCCVVGWSWDEHWTVSHLLADPPELACALL